MLNNGIKNLQTKDELNVCSCWFKNKLSKYF